MPGLHEDDLDPDPIAQFSAWYGDAGTDAVALVTASADGEPAGRMVLLKGADERGFAFFTNYTSPKARDLAANPRAALVFHWPPHRQVRVAGPVTKVDQDESERYWRSRPRGSQLSAWASHQSEVVPSRVVLEARVAELDARFGPHVPSPPFWGGFRLVPSTIEFWQHRDDRLHDRLRYRREGEDWVIERLSP
ncbi:MAG: pyridoxamine 5'-phosphate oxidase [Acidimicrobiales bacterium]